MGGFSYPNNFHLEADFVPDAIGAAGLTGIIVLIVLMVLMVVTALAVICYIFQSLGLQAIAKSRGIRNSWLAWLPVTWMWILGSISDQYQYVVRCNITNRRKTLLILGIVANASYSVYDVVTTLFSAMGNAISVRMGALHQLTLFGLVAIGLAVVSTVVEYICLFDLYRSCKPDKRVGFLVLSIVFPVTIPFFIFSCRKEERGMPPRKQPAPQPVEAESPIEPSEVIVEDAPEETAEEIVEEIQEISEEE